MSCVFCNDSGLRSDGRDFGVCGRCSAGIRLRDVLVSIARREPVAINNVDDRQFYAAPCAYLDPMIETSSYTAGNFYGPKRED